MMNPKENEQPLKMEGSQVPSESPTNTKASQLSQNGRIFRTLLINLSFVSLGLCEAIKGPTLLDLKDLFQTTISTISYMFILRSIGSIIGSFTGRLFDRFGDRYKYFILFAYTAILGLANAFLTSHENVGIFFIMMWFSGFAGGSLDTVGNVVCLDIWKGHNGGPFFHSIHFAFAVGAFFAPVLAGPFLTENSDIDFKTPLAHYTGQEVATNLTSDGPSPPSQHLPTNSNYNEDDGTLTIRSLYPIVGTLTLLSSLGFLAMALKDRKTTDKKVESAQTKATTGSPAEGLALRQQLDKHPSPAGNQAGREQPALDSQVNVEDPSAEVCDGDDKFRHWPLLVTMLTFIFLYVGMEVIFGTYVHTFAVICDLHLSKVEGAMINAIFWGTFAAARFLGIFVAMKVDPLPNMIFNLVTCEIGSFALSLFGQKYPVALFVFSGFMGAGMATIYACAVLWLEQSMEITGRIGSIMVISGSVGADMFPIVLGQFIAGYPMLLMYIQVGVVNVCLVLFLIMFVIIKKIQHRDCRNRTRREEHSNKRSAIMALDPLVDAL